MVGVAVVVAVVVAVGIVVAVAVAVAVVVGVAVEVAVAVAVGVAVGVGVVVQRRCAMTDPTKTVSTQTTVRVMLAIDCGGSPWTDDVSLATVHREAVMRATAIIGRLLQGKAAPGDVACIKVLGVDQHDVHVIVKPLR